jgi:hypothetical protein
MPSGDHAAGKAGQRARGSQRADDIANNGGPRPTPPHKPGLDWFAANLEPRFWDDIKNELRHVGDLEALIGSVSISGGGATCQLQILPAYVHHAVDMTQWSTQGVLVARVYIAPFELFKQDTAAWLDPADTSIDDDEDWAVGDDS